MKKIKLYTALFALVASIGFTSCSDATDVELKPFDPVGGYNTMNNEESEAYYANLREYKKQAINYGRPVAFGWFSGWAPTGTYRHGYLTSMPDSMDIVSMWSGAPGRYDITPEQKKDKDFVQKVKGTKLLEVTLLSYLGKARTPEYVYKEVRKKAEAEGWNKDAARMQFAEQEARWKFWGFEGTVYDKSGSGFSKNYQEAMDRYAKALCDSLVTGEWDGFDIDWEIGSGVFDMDGTLSNTDQIVYLVKKMNEYIGPKSDPENKGHKLICIDGQYTSLIKYLEGYVDYWIDQSYSGSVWLGKVPDPRKLIITENFELHSKDGGSLLRLAAMMPDNTYKGGVGAYRFDGDYDNYPNYKWMRQAIQINQKVFQEWKSKQKDAPKP